MSAGVPINAGTPRAWRPSAAVRTVNRVSAPAASAYSLPFLVTMAYLIVDYGRPQSWVPALAALKPGTIVLGSGMVALAATQRIPRDTLSKYMLAFLGLMAALIPFAFNRHRAFDETWLFTLLLFGAMLPIVAFVDSYERLRIVMRLWVGIHVPLAIYSFTHRGTGAGAGGMGVGSFLSDENDFALALDMAIPYAYALFLIERGFVRRLAALLTTLLLITAVAGTMSRGGFVGLVCLGAVVWLHSDRKALSLGAIAAAAAVLIAFAPASYWHEVESIETADRAGDTGNQRLYYWTIGWHMFLDHPIIGVGPSNFGFNAPDYETSDRQLQGEHVWGRAAHSVYFTLLPELAVPGVVLFAAMLVHGVRLRRRIRRDWREVVAAGDAAARDRERARWFDQITSAIDASLVAFLTSGAFISVLYYPHIWLLTAFTAAVGNVARAELGDRIASPLDRPTHAGAARQRQLLTTARRASKAWSPRHGRLQAAG